MSRLLRFTALLFLLVSPIASARGISLCWGECVADGGVRNVTFACNTNLGHLALVNSFMLSAALPGVTRVDGTIDVIAADVALPEWWNFRFCRAGSMII